jgi:ABC superfamily ATP binding cassette transporter, ATPase
VDFAGLGQILKLMFIVLILAVVFQWVMNQVNTYLSFHVIEDLRKKAFSHIQAVPLSSIDSKEPGEILSRLTTDIEQISQGLFVLLNQFLQAVFSILETAFFLFLLEWRIALILLALTPLSFFIAKFISKRAYLYFQNQSKSRGEIAAFSTEAIGNAKLLKAFMQDAPKEALYQEKNERLSRYSMQANFYSSLVNPFTRFLNALGYALVGGVGAMFCLQGTLSIGQLSSLLAYATQYAKPFNDITSVITEIQNALAAASRVFDFLEEEEMKPKAEIRELPKPVEGCLELSGLYFSYTKEQKLIQDLSLSVQSGQNIAIVGPTGCGKTTLINLLMRFYEPNQGSIAIDGMPYGSLSDHSLRSVYGMVLQDSWLKSDTVLENIRYGSPEKSREEVMEAAKRAGCHHFILQLAKGYDTILPEDGGNLSQGQKQLLCIARVMLRDPAILILDEATSSIDTRTEEKVQRAFREMLKGRTAFIVAHRLSTIQNADCILVMKDGNVIEKGSHEELLQQKGFYKNLYESQFQGAEN